MTDHQGRGIVRGQTIELSDDLGLTDGQEIEVIVRVQHPGPVWGAGIEASAGGMIPHWTAEDDRILDEIQRDRHLITSREIPE